MRQLADANKEKAILGEKLSSSEAKRDDNKVKIELEISTLRDTVSALNEQISKERDAYLQETDRLRNLMQEQEKQLLDV